MVKTLSRPVAQEPDLAQLDACRQIIGQHCYSTQEEIRRELSERGFADISQSTISRLLRR
ncbi:MAG: ArgR family transcriptional regulator, partial [Aeromonas veronii]